tara:strand:- start:222 stop:596 length:375 start_codon:yes stop_codon:yes gene_type:complete
MGLDMYLSKKVKYKRKNHVDEVMYWRKENAIHAWFVKNVQDGKDECQESSVSVESLTKLANLCEQAVKEKNPDLLPTQGGFFFGSTDYDEYYYQSLEETSKVIREELNSNSSLGRTEYFYQSSW